MIEKSEAIVLRVAPFSQTSHVVTWLAPCHGRIATLVKGACRPKSQFLGQYDLFYTCEIVFYPRQGLNILRECSPVQTRNGLRCNWRGAVSASYASDLAMQMSTAGSSHDADLYALHTMFLDHVTAHNASIPHLLWLELRMLEKTGLAPRLDRCVSCRAAVGDARRILFAAGIGGVLCPVCAPRGGAGILAVTPRDLALLYRWQGIQHPATIQADSVPRGQQLALTRLLGVYLRYHMETLLRSRRIAIGMLDSKPQQNTLPTA
jgi:DNA repair protein RecO (recombination protein O)